MKRWMWAGAWLATAAIAAAQQASPPGAREREALRRAQAAIVQAQQRESELIARLGDAIRERDGLAQALRRQERRVAELEARLRRERAAGEQAQAEADAQRARTAEVAAQARDRLAEAAQAEQALRRELQAARALADERLQANRQLTAMLEASTTALAQERERSRRLHALAHEAVDLHAGKTPWQQATAGERVFGFTAVRIEDQAEAMRKRIDQALAEPAAPAKSP